MKPHASTRRLLVRTLIAGLQRKAMGIEIDALSRDQEDYLDSWEEGT